MKIVIFDVCDTIYKTNTTFFFLDCYFKNNKKFYIFRKLTRFYPLIVLNYIFYKFFKKDFIRLYATSFLKGEEIKKVKSFSAELVKTKLSELINTSVEKMIKEYKNEGYQVVLMSGSYDFLIEQVAKYFTTDLFYASKLKVSENFYTGKYEDDILMNKFQLFKKDFKFFDKLSVVSNNKTDLELMKFADQSFAVCLKQSDENFWKKYNNIYCLKDY